MLVSDDCLPKQGGLGGLGLFSTYAPTIGQNMAYYHSLPPGAQSAWMKYLEVADMRRLYEEAKWEGRDRTFHRVEKLWNALGGYAGFDAAVSNLKINYPHVWAYIQNPENAQKTGGLGQGADEIAAIALIAVAGAAAGGGGGGAGAAGGGGGGAGGSAGGAVVAPTTATTGAISAGMPTITAEQALQAAAALAAAAGSKGPDGGQGQEDMTVPVDAMSAQPGVIQATLKKWGIPAAFAAFMLLR